MKLKRQLHGPQDPRGPSHGRDVRDFVKRTLHRLPNQVPVGADFFPKPKAGFDLVYNAKTVEAIEVLRQLEDRRPIKRPFAQDDLDYLWEHADDFSKWVYDKWSVPKPALVEPDQGFASLDRSLWKTYSLGRRAGLSDLGTFNPASTLPSGARSDHAVYPAFAYDLGIDPDTGWQNVKARTVALQIVRDPKVEYVILGNRIWTDWRMAWGSYYSGGHFNHMHVSGDR